MKKFFHQLTAFLLIIGITLGYAGIPVFKMICKAEAGKVVVSITNPDAQCEHNHPEKPSCCHKPVEKAPCCDFTHHTVQIKDNSTAGGESISLLSPLLITKVIIWPRLALLLHAQQATTALPRPPLLHLNNKSRLSITQVYLI